MTGAFPHLPAVPNFVAIQRQLQAHLDQLRHWSGQATPAQLTALSAIEDFIAEAGRQQSGWGRLRLIAMRGRGAFLRKTPRLRGRRKKESDATDTLRSLAELGIKNRRHASRDMKIADIPQNVFDRYLAQETYPTEKGLHRFSTLKGDHEHGYLLAPDYLKEGNTSEFGELWDGCPFPRPPNFDCLKEDWPARVYLNALWIGNFLDYMKKAVEQIQRHPDALYYIVAPTRPSVNYLLEAHGVNGITIEMRSLGRPPWRHTQTGKPHPSPMPAMAIILRRGATVPATANMDLLNGNADSIVERVMADPDKAAEVSRLLGEQLGLSKQRKKQDWNMRTENQAQPDEPEARYNLPIIDKARGWDTWRGKLRWLDGLSFADKLREGPALLSKFDDWLDQILGITPAWKKHVARL
jgi:hypothetical protein